MGRTRVLLSVVLLLHIPGSLSNCRVTQTFRGVAQYRCDSVRELEEQGNSEVQHVAILNDNLTPAVSSSSFQKTPNLKWMKIERSVSGFDRGAFQSLKDLAHLIINNNELRELKKGVYNNLPLEYLDLSHNSIIYIEPGTFLNLTSLKVLYMRNNHLPRVSKGVFNNLPVERLGLSTNRIYVLEREAFYNMTHLKRLHLDGNLLSQFPSENIINYGHTLDILWLHNNTFKEVNRNTVKGFTNLRLLNLQDNIISRISPYTLENVLNLEVLVLSNNSLNTLDVDVFPEDGMPKLSKLYLNDNRLSYLNTKVLGRLSHLKAIRLGGNPWQCPCFDTILVWLKDHEVTQNCDKDYYNGTRPICVIADAHPTTCTYDNDPNDYQKYMEANSNFPKNTPCAL